MNTMMQDVMEWMTAECACMCVCVCVCVGCLNIFGELAYFWSITDVNGDYTNPKEEIKM